MGASEDATQAYDRLVNFVQANLNNEQMPYDPITGIAVDNLGSHLSDLVDDYGHALAEIIHEAAKERAAATGGRYAASEIFKIEGMHTAANLIDPYLPEDRG